MISWKEEYRVGVETIDGQHQKLLEIAARAHDLLTNELLTDKYDKIVLILDELRDYTIYHFKSEEEYMQSISYKRLLSQKVEHSEFIELINTIDLNKIDDGQNEYLMGILDFVVGWIDSHILKKDKLITAG